MPFINLIQEQRLAVRRNERVARMFFLAFGGIACVSVIGFLGLMLEGEIISRQRVKLQDVIRRNEPIEQQTQEMQAQIDEMSPKVKTLEDAQELTVKWNRLLDHLAVQTPDKTWLTSLRATVGDPQKPISVAFLGLAQEQGPVGEFILRLQNSADLDNVTLKYTQEKIAAQGLGIEFQVDADLVGTAEQQEVKDEAKQESKS